MKTFHLDNRAPGERAEFLAYWTELLLSGAPALLAAGKVSQDVVDGMTRELERRRARSEQRVLLLVHPGARARMVKLPAEYHAGRDGTAAMNPP